MSLFNDTKFFKPVKKVVESDTKPQSCHLPAALNDKKDHEVLVVNRRDSKDYPVGFEAIKALFLTLMSKTNSWRDSDLERASCARIYSTCENITRRFELVARAYAEELFDDRYINYEDYQRIFNQRCTDAKGYKVFNHSEEIGGVKISYVVRVYYGSVSKKRSTVEQRYEQIEDLVYGYEGVD